MTCCNMSHLPFLLGFTWADADLREEICAGGLLLGHRTQWRSHLTTFSSGTSNMKLIVDEHKFPYSCSST